MADKPKTPQPNARRHRRAAPTIDLTATELTPAAGPTTPDAPTVHEPPPQEPPAQEPPVHEPPAQEPPPDTDGPRPAAETRRRGSVSGATLAAGAAGAVLMTLVLFALWLTGLVPIRYAGSTALRARVTGLEMRLHDLQSRPAAVTDTKSIDDLKGRVAKIEAAVADLPAGDPGLAERVAAADNAMKALGLALTALNRRSDDIAANASQARARAEAAEKTATELRASVQSVAKDASAGISSVDLEPLQKRIAALEQYAKAAREAIAKVGAADTAARLALSAAALRNAVVSGAPFATVLAQTKALGADDKALAALAPFAASGVPTQNALAQELRALVPALHKVSGAQPPAGGFIERLQANAGNLVRIRPVDAPPGDDAAAVLARIESEAARGDIAAALDDLGRLDETARAPAQDWIDKAKARQAALSAARALAADTTRVLAPKGGAQ